MNLYLGDDRAGWRSVQVPEAASSAPQALGIDVRFGWSTYIGDARQVVLRKIAVDAAGNTYAVANRIYPECGLNPLYRPPHDVIVVKLDPSGSIVYTTYLGGKGNDQGRAIAVDAAGNVWVGGSTTSPNFPLQNPIQLQPGTAFLSKLDANGVLVYSTYLGGKYYNSDTYVDAVTAIAVDAGGNAYFAGETWSPNLPVTPGAFQQTGYTDLGVSVQSTGFVGKLNPAGSLVYLTYLGGRGAECHGFVISCLGQLGYDSPAAIAVDSAGNAYVAGSSNKVHFPVTQGAPQAMVDGPFVAKLNATGTALIYSTGLGGLADNIYQYDSATAIAVDSAGNAYVTGVTKSPTFPVTAGALQTEMGEPPPSGGLPPFDGFVTKINPTGTALVYSTYLGGPGDDSINDIVVDAAGDAYVTGVSPALELPADGTLPQGQSFVAEVNPTGSGIAYAARLPTGLAGGFLADSGRVIGGGIALDAAGKLHLAGPPAVVSILDRASPIVPAVLAVSNAAGTQISGRVAAGELVSLWGTGLGPATPAGGVVENGFFTNSVAGVQVFFDELAAPVLYVSDKQVNAVAPWELASRAMTTVKVVYQGAAVRAFTLTLAPADPEVFKNPDGSAAALNEDGTRNSPSNLAKPGSIVTIFGTGTDIAPGVNGSINNPVRYTGSVHVLDNEYFTDLPIDYAGAAPALVSGVAQVNFHLPNGIGGYANQYAFTLADGQYSMTGNTTVFYGPVYTSAPVYIYVSH